MLIVLPNTSAEASSQRVMSSGDGNWAECHKWDWCLQFKGGGNREAGEPWERA